jgi:hypothetical protein
MFPVPGLPAPEPVAGCWLGSPVVEVLLCFIDLSMISSQKTPGGMGRHWDPIFAKLPASSLLAVTTSNLITNSKCPLCIPPQSQNHVCDIHNVVDIQFHRHYNTMVQIQWS